MENQLALRRKAGDFYDFWGLTLADYQGDKEAFVDELFDELSAHESFDDAEERIVKAHFRRLIRIRG